MALRSELLVEIGEDNIEPFKLSKWIWEWVPSDWKLAPGDVLSWRHGEEGGRTKVVDCDDKLNGHQKCSFRKMLKREAAH